VASDGNRTDGLRHETEGGSAGGSAAEGATDDDLADLGGDGWVAAGLQGVADAPEGGIARDGACDGIARGPVTLDHDGGD